MEATGLTLPWQHQGKPKGTTESHLSAYSPSAPAPRRPSCWLGKLPDAITAGDRASFLIQEQRRETAGPGTDCVGRQRQCLGRERGRGQPEGSMGPGARGGF